MKNINEELYDALYSQFRSHITRHLSGSIYNIPFKMHMLLDVLIHQQLDYPIESQLNSTK
jgi:hypothetical protein